MLGVFLQSSLVAQQVTCLLDQGECNTLLRRSNRSDRAAVGNKGVGKRRQREFLRPRGCIETLANDFLFRSKSACSSITRRADARTEVSATSTDRGGSVLDKTE